MKSRWMIFVHSWTNTVSPSLVRRPRWNREPDVESVLTLVSSYPAAQGMSQNAIRSSPPSRRKVVPDDGDATAGHEDDRPHASRTLAGRAFWPILCNIIVFAGSIDIFHFVLFLCLGVPELAWPNTSSVVLYTVAYFLVKLGRRGVAAALIWTEVVLHATAGTLLLGWESGFHYQMLIFLPAIVVATRRWHTKLLLLLLFAFYIGMDVCSYFIGPTNPLPEAALAIVRWTNVATMFAMFSYAAVCYRNRLRHTEEHIRYCATRDPLTGLSNQQHFLAMAEHELACQQRSHDPIAIAVVDVDLLEQANTGSRDAGDAVLAHVGRELRKSCRLEDVAARWESDEFVILMPGTNWQDAMAVAERIRLAVASTGAGSPQNSFRGTVSIGVSELVPNETLRDALSRADRALHRSKRCGRDRVSGEPPPPSSAVPEKCDSAVHGWCKSGWGARE